MNSKVSKRIKKALLEKPIECLMFLRSQLGSKTEKMDELSIYHNFKRLYKEGKVPQKLLAKGKKNEQD